MVKDVMDEAATSTWLSDVLDARDPRKAIGVPEVAPSTCLYAQTGGVYIAAVFIIKVSLSITNSEVDGYHPAFRNCMGVRLISTCEPKLDLTGHARV